tara:strand:- start:165 stop:272 length:108 start_codon:yes stop_codon:yes gene_type:complete
MSSFKAFVKACPGTTMKKITPNVKIKGSVVKMAKT